MHHFVIHILSTCVTNQNPWRREGLHLSLLKEQDTKGAYIRVSWNFNFYVCLGWGNSSIVVHIVVDSLRCVEDVEFFGQMIWSTMVLIVIINCSLLLLTDRKHIFWDVSCRSIVHDSFVHVGSTGPVFDEDGQVLTHTILGSWEDFQQEAIKRGDIEVFCV